MQVGLQNHQMQATALKEELANHGRRQVRSLERGLGVLETVAAVSPILGLLGTVVGMIKVFKIISIQGVGEASALSGGISEALITTAAGLTVAIPALVFYNYFSLKAENLVHEIEDHAGDLVRRLTSFSREQ
jgi:biopolymer transport protein ExbB